MNAQLELERNEWQRIGGLCVIRVHWVSGYIGVVSGGRPCPYVRLQDSRCIQQNSAMDAAGIRRPVTQIPARGDTGVAGTHCGSAQGWDGVAALSAVMEAFLSSRRSSSSFCFTRDPSRTP